MRFFNVRSFLTILVLDFIAWCWRKIFLLMTLQMIVVTTKCPTQASTSRLTDQIRQSAQKSLFLELIRYVLYLDTILVLF